MSIVFFGMLASQIIFALVVISLNNNRDFRPQSSDTTFLYIVPVVAVICFLLSRVLFDKIRDNARSQDSLKGKATIYQAAFLARIACLEAASLFGIVTYFLTGNFFLLGVSALIILYFLTLNPTKERVTMDLSLDYDQQKQFDRSEEVMP